MSYSDHGPATPGSCKESYFRSLILAPRDRANIRLLYGIEANIKGEDGSLDIRQDVLKNLDYCIAGIHLPVFNRASGRCQLPGGCDFSGTGGC